VAAVVLGVLPLDQRDLDVAVAGPMTESGVGARGPRPSAAITVRHFTEVVPRADVLERDTAPGLDGEHLADVEDGAECGFDPSRVVVHRHEGVDALHL
jgi:hypothetical protein